MLTILSTIGIDQNVIVLRSMNNRLNFPNPVVSLRGFESWAVSFIPRAAMFVAPTCIIVAMKAVVINKRS